MRYWNDPHLPGLSLMCADFTTHRFEPHFHDALVVAVTESGGSEITCRGRAEYVCASSLLVFNPAQPHASRMGWSAGWRYRAFHLAQPAIDAVAEGLGLPTVPDFAEHLVEDGALAGRFLALHRALEEGRDPLGTGERLYGAFGALFRRYGSGRGRITDASADRVLVAAVVDYMHAHHAEDLLLEEMGRLVGLTPFQLIRAFKKSVGLTPHAYLTQVRLRAACRLLQRGTAIADAAAAAGFYDQSALTRHFKRSYGVTPLQFVQATCGRRACGRSSAEAAGARPG